MKFPRYKPRRIKNGDLDFADIGGSMGSSKSRLIEDLNDPDLVLVTDSQDVEAVKDQVPEAKEYDGFFVKVGEGDYSEVWGFEGSVPWLYKRAWRVK